MATRRLRALTDRDAWLRTDRRQRTTPLCRSPRAFICSATADGAIENDKHRRAGTVHPLPTDGILVAGQLCTAMEPETGRWARSYGSKMLDGFGLRAALSANGLPHKEPFSCLHRYRIDSQESKAFTACSSASIPAARPPEESNLYTERNCQQCVLATRLGHCCCLADARERAVRHRQIVAERS